MPRENSLSDEDGRSLTPDLEDDRPGVEPPRSPTYETRPLSLETDRPLPRTSTTATQELKSPKSLTGRSARLKHHDSTAAVQESNIPSKDQTFSYKVSLH